MIRYLFKRDTLLATLLVFALMGMLALIPLNTHVLDPIKLALHDFDYNDLAYSRLQKNSESSIDTSIVIVNVGSSGRSDIATMIQKVQQEQPRIIGVDVLFEQPKTPAEDSLLINVFATSSNLVLAYKLRDEMRPYGFLLDSSRQKGFTNLVGEEGGVIRHFTPVIKKDNNTWEAFSTAVAAKADPQRYKELLDRDKAVETINYKLTPDKFIIVDGIEFLAGTGGVFLKDKIVLLGFAGEKATDIEDKHFTPMNSRSFGKSNPDMYGVLIHANIIHMILHGDYITKMPIWVTWVIAFLLCWIHMAVFLHYALERHLWFHLAAKTAQVLSAIFFIYLGLMLFYKWDYKINLTPAFVGIILAVDVLYFYEAICHWLHKKYRVSSVFSKHKH